MSTRAKPLSRCPACGRQFHLTAASPRPPAVCPECGSATDAPPDRGRDEPTAERYLLAAGTTEDDGKAYGVFGEKPVPPCPSCNRALPDDVDVCGHCNWHRDAGKVLPRTYAPLDITWEAGWPFHWRVLAFLACQVLNVVTAALIWWQHGTGPASASGWIMITLMQAFVLGTYDRVDLQRTTKGKVTLSKMWRVCFVPIKPNVIRWREHEGVGVRHDQIGGLDWAIFLVLLLSGLFCIQVSSIILAVLFWWYVIYPGRVMVALTQNLGDPVTILYAGGDSNRATEIAETVRDATGMTYDPLA